MRYIFVFTIILVTSGLYFLQRVPQFRLWQINTAEQLRTYLYDPEILMSGVSERGERSVARALPRGKSILWWAFHVDDVVQTLMAQGRFESVRLNRCAFLRTDCYRILVKEREPGFVAYVGQQPWLVDHSGAFIEPVTLENFDLLGGAKNLIIVRGLSTNIGSPEIMSARMRRVAETLQHIQAITALDPREVELRSAGELGVRFRKYDFVAVFDVESSDSKNVIRHAQRLAQIVKQFRGREMELQQIDLAFDRTAVVKLHEEYADRDGVSDENA